MTELIHFALDVESSIAVEVDLADGGFAPAGPRDHPRSSNESFSTALAHGRRAAEQALDQFRNMKIRPDEIQLHLGLKLSPEADIVLARSVE